MSGPRKKLRVDFRGSSRLRAAMDKDTIELIAQLCTRAAMIMEDVSEIALTIEKAEAEQRTRVLLQLETAADRIRCLVQAVALER